MSCLVRRARTQTVDSILEREPSKLVTQGFRAAWSTVLAVSGALANVGTPVPLGWAYQGSLAALLLLAIFTAMSLPYDSTEVRLP